MPYFFFCNCTSGVFIENTVFVHNLTKLHKKIRDCNYDSTIFEICDYYLHISLFFANIATFLGSVLYEYDAPRRSFDPIVNFEI